MKQGTNSIMRVNIDTDFDTIEKIDFVFQQEETRLKFTYPSDRAVAAYNDDEEIIGVDIVWTADETYMFSTKKPVYMDSKISIEDVETNPETTIAKFFISPTLFKKGE